MFRHPNLPGADRPSGEIGGRFLTDFNVWHDHRSPRRAKGFTGNQNLQSRPPENWPLPPSRMLKPLAAPRLPFDGPGTFVRAFQAAWKSPQEQVWLNPVAKPAILEAD
jgi:hypothetical protein